MKLLSALHRVSLSAPFGRVCCLGPVCRIYWSIAARPALSSKCEPCHVVSWRTNCYWDRTKFDKSYPKNEKGVVVTETYTAHLSYRPACVCRVQRVRSTVSRARFRVRASATRAIPATTTTPLHTSARVRLPGQPSRRRALSQIQSSYH